MASRFVGWVARLGCRLAGRLTGSLACLSKGWPASWLLTHLVVLNQSCSLTTTTTAGTAVTCAEFTHYMSHGSGGSSITPCAEVLGPLPDAGRHRRHGVPDDFLCVVEGILYSYSHSQYLSHQLRIKRILFHRREQHNCNTTEQMSTSQTVLHIQNPSRILGWYLATLVIIERHVKANVFSTASRYLAGFDDYIALGSARGQLRRFLHHACYPLLLLQHLILVSPFVPLSTLSGIQH